MKTLEQMPNVTLKQAAKYLEQKKPFKASNFFAVKDLQGNYIVYSFATIMLIIYADNSKNYLDTNFYSRTTSRHQSIIKKTLSL